METKPDYTTKTAELKQEAEFHETQERLSNPPSLRTMQEQRLKEIDEERKAANKRAQELEEQRLQRIQDESESTAAEAAHQRELREKAEADLRTQRDGMILEELRRLQGLQVSPEKKIEEYFSFQEMMEKRFGKTKEPEPPKSGAMDSHLLFEIEKMKLDFERWKVDQERLNKQMEYDREDKREERKENKELKKEEIELKKNQQKMFSDLPKVFADTLAAGIVARTTGGVASDVSSVSADPGAHDISHFEAVEGEAGELDCPKCNTKVGVGPTTNQTVCAKCGHQFQIKRVPGAAPPVENKAGPTGIGSIL